MKRYVRFDRVWRNVLQKREGREPLENPSNLAAVNWSGRQDLNLRERSPGNAASTEEGRQPDHPFVPHRRDFDATAILEHGDEGENAGEGKIHVPDRAIDFVETIFQPELDDPAKRDDARALRAT